MGNQGMAIAYCTFYWQNIIIKNNIIIIPCGCALLLFIILCSNRTPLFLVVTNYNSC